MADDTKRPGQRAAWWTFSGEDGDGVYYFAPAERRSPPYKEQRRVSAILDIAEDGTLAGIELVSDNLPPPPEPDKAD